MDNTINLSKEDISFLLEEIAKVAKSILKGLSKKQLHLNHKLADHINTMTKAINEVKRIVEADTYSVDPNDVLETPLLLPPVNIDIQAWAMDTGTSEFVNVSHWFETLYMDFSKLTLAEVYTFQHAAVTEIRIRDNSLTY